MQTYKHDLVDLAVRGKISSNMGGRRLVPGGEVPEAVIQAVLVLGAPRVCVDRDAERESNEGRKAREHGFERARGRTAGNGRPGATASLIAAVYVGISPERPSCGGRGVVKVPYGRIYITQHCSSLHRAS
jgi:hypothetical protein